MRNKQFFIIKSEKIQFVIKLLTEKIGLPEINPNLVVYAKKENQVLELNFLNANCSLRSYNKKSEKDKKYLSIFQSTPPINIENKNIKYFLKILQDLNINQAYIGEEIINLTYKKKSKIIASIKENTLIGNLLTLHNQENILKLLPTGFVKKISPKEIDELVIKNNKLTKIFDKNGFLNNKILKYANNYGIDLGSFGKSSIKLKMNYKSNDYSFYETYFKKILGFEFQSKIKNLNNQEKHFKPISIIIPSYNSERSLLFTLYSIQSQSLSMANKKKIEVIVVDDGSKKNINELIKPHEENFSFELQIIRLKKNLGSSSARNLGATISQNDGIIFLDSDIILSKNYILLYSILNQMFPHALLMSLKKNISIDSSFLNFKKILKGLEIPDSFDDKRISKYLEKDSVNLNKINISGIFDILSDTDSLKLLGHGRIINGYDLPSAVVSHNICLRKNSFLEIEKFNNQFEGWGLEDTYLGACMIATGNFIIPILSTGVYHINHVSRSSNPQKEEIKNIIKYNELINIENE